MKTIEVDINDVGHGISQLKNIKFYQFKKNIILIEQYDF